MEVRIAAKTEFLPELLKDRVAYLPLDGHLSVMLRLHNYEQSRQYAAALRAIIFRLTGQV